MRAKSEEKLHAPGISKHAQNAPVWRRNFTFLQTTETSARSGKLSLNLSKTHVLLLLFQPAELLLNSVSDNLRTRSNILK